jgi:hypothetical protein
MASRAAGLATGNHAVGCRYCANNRNTLFYLASWIWEQGGDFLTLTIEVAFDPQALEGMPALLNWLRFLPRRTHRSQTMKSTICFCSEKWRRLSWTVAVEFSLQPELVRRTLLSDGNYSPPGPSFVRGTCLVV